MSLVDLGKRLLEAAKRGDTDDVRTLMSNGAPFTTDWLGTSPLHFAAQEGHLQTAEVLLRAGISRDARTKVDRTPLHVASQEGHTEIVELLLMHSADVDAKDMLKMTPLHWATEKGCFEVADTLIKQGADINCENKFDKTPLDIAISNGRTDLIQLLQLAQVSKYEHTAVAGLTEGESVTIETSESVIPETEDSIIPLSSHVQTSAAKDVDKGVLPMTIVQNTSTKVSDQNSTSVLATLAALAEASGPMNTQNVNTSDAVNWLESQGVTMITTSDGGIITSAVESGQTITLTEAGKIALNLIKTQGLNDTEVIQHVADSPDVGTAIDTVVGDTGSQKVITIVSNSANTEIPPVSGSPVIVTMATETVNDGSGDAQSAVLETVETVEEATHADMVSIKSEGQVEDDKELQTAEELSWLQFQ